MDLVRFKTEADWIEVNKYLSIVLYSEGDYPRPVVRNTDAGALFCLVHQGGWCEDIKISMSLGDDYESIVADRDATVSNIIVPILPSAHNIYANVWLDPVNDAVMRANLWNPTAEAKGFVPVDTKIPLGLMAPGDGRIQLRQMVIDWITPNMETIIEKHRCSSLRHTPGRHASMRHKVKSDLAGGIANAWCIFWYQRCEMCLIDEGVNKPDNDDLVPSI